MTNQFRRLGGAILTCALLLGYGVERSAVAQSNKPSGPPKGSDGYLSVGVLFDDNGLRVEKADKVVASVGKRVDFYLVNLSATDVEFYVEFSKSKTSHWICAEQQNGSDGKKDKRPARQRGDGAFSCTLKKSVIDAACGREKPCLVDFFYRFTQPGSDQPLKVDGDPQLEIRR
jgi:hypothetical protein